VTVFDTLRWPVSRHELINGDLLDRLPVYLRNRWWCDIQERIRVEDTPYVYGNETPDYMRWWLQSVNDHRLETMMYKLREAIAKYNE